VSEVELLAQRIDVIERGYEYLLAYAAQGRQEETGTELRGALQGMHEAMTAMQGSVRAVFAGLPESSGAMYFTDAVEHDVQAARGALGVVLSRERIGSLLIDNFNASVHVRALLTDLFLIEQALKSPQGG
jgi:hypothetical protein